MYLDKHCKKQPTGHIPVAQAGLGHKHQAIADLHRAIELARPVGDPLMLLRAAVALLAMDGCDELAVEARQAVERITAALSNESMRHSFEAAEPVQFLSKV